MKVDLWIRALAGRIIYDLITLDEHGRGWIELDQAGVDELISRLHSVSHKFLLTVDSKIALERRAASELECDASYTDEQLIGWVEGGSVDAPMEIVNGVVSDPSRLAYLQEQMSCVTLTYKGLSEEAKAKAKAKLSNIGPDPFLDGISQEARDKLEGKVLSTKVSDQPLVTTEHKDYTTGAKRGTDSGRGRYDLITRRFLKRLAIHLEKGAKEYAPRNWESGLPLYRSANSTIRHLEQWLAGETDEDHLAAVACNIMFLIHTEELISEGALPLSLLEQLPLSYFKSRDIAPLEHGETND